MTSESAASFPVPDLPEAPLPEWRYRRAFAVGRAVRALVQARAVVWGLVVRQVRSQYSQQVLGVAWALITPLAQTLLFTVLLNRVGSGSTLRTGGVPRPLFLYVGLTAWSFFSSSVSSGGNSLTGNPLLNKVYAPREVFPIAQVISSGINAVASTLVLPILFILNDRHPAVTSLWLPLPLLVLVAFTVAVTLIVSATTVYARDLRSGLPLILQLGMFSPGVLYRVPETIRSWYGWVNPVGASIDSMRECIFSGHAPQANLLVGAAVASAIWLFAGFVFFKKLETGFADVS